MGSHYSPVTEEYLRHCQPLRRTMSPSPDRDQRPRRRSRSPRRRSRSPDFYPPIESETRRQRSRSPRRRSRSPDSHQPNEPETRQKTPFAKQYDLRPRRDQVDIDERLVIDLVTPEPEVIPTIENAVIEDINAANILHPSQTYTVPVDKASPSTLDPIFTLDPLLISRRLSSHRDGEGIHGIAAAFRGPESERANRIRTTFADAFGGSRKLDLPSRSPPHNHPLPPRTDSDASLVPSSSRSALAKNPEPFSGKVVNNLNRTVAKKLASDMLEMPLYKDGVYYYIFWTDGSFQRVNTCNKGGAAAVWFDSTRHEWYSWREKPPYGETTSNDTELLGIGIALRKASSFIAKFQQDYPAIINARHEVFVFTDSSACLQLIPRAHFYPLCKQWARESLLTDILEASALLKQLGANIQLHWVPSHSGVIGNEVADREARYAAHDEYVGQQAPSRPWERQSPITTTRAISHTTRKHRDMVNRINCLLHPEDSEDYISLL